MHRIITIICICASSCAFVSEGMPLDESSSSSSSDADDGTATILTSATTQSPSGSSSSEESSSDDSGTSESAGETSEESGGTDESSTGDRISDYGLRFDGTSYARKIDDGRPSTWPSADFAVEAWIDIEDTSSIGVIFDATDAAFTSGWVLYLHNDMHALVFSVFNEAGFNQVVVGPDVQDIGTGWHHVAAVKSGGSAKLYVDGVLAAAQSVSPMILIDADAAWSMGGNSVDNLDFRLRGVTVDDVRISAAAIYDADFIPPQVYEDSDATLLHLALDEGDGDVAGGDGADFEIEGAAWVAGNAE